MIPNAFYEVKYSYDRGIKRWQATFHSREVEGLALTIPLVDDSVSFDGDDIVCTSEEALGLMFLQYAENVAVARNQQQQEAEKAKAYAAQQEHPLAVPEPE